jgi:hypothetical protein
MSDDQRLAPLGVFTPEGNLTQGYGDHYLFLVGRDDAHGILHYLLTHETLGFEFNQYGYADDQLNQDVLALLKNPGVVVQGTLDKSQAGGVHERKLVALDEANDPAFGNSIAIGESATHQISHTKGGVLAGLGIAFEGSTNWSTAGEGEGISLRVATGQPKGFKAQNNTLLVSTNPVLIARFRTQLAIEHRIALAQERTIRR